MTATLPVDIYMIPHPVFIPYARIPVKYMLDYTNISVNITSHWKFLLLSLSSEK